MTWVFLALVAAAAYWVFGRGVSTVGRRRVRLPVIASEDADELAAYIADEHKKKDTYYRAQLASGQELAFGVTAGDDWVDIISRKRKRGEKDGHFTGKFATFGFSFSEARWSYGEGPPGAAEIRTLIRDELGGPSRVGRFQRS